MSAHPPKMRNLLLAQIDTVERGSLFEHMTHITLDKGQYLVRSHKPIEHIYFLESGVASVISDRSDQVHVELAVIGREGVTGIAALLGAQTAPQDTLVQIDHAHAWRIATPNMLGAMADSGAIRSLILRFVQTVFVQAAANAAANVSDRLNARLARWLLMCHDRVDGDEILLTHEYMGVMLGAPRSAVTSALHALEGDNLIRSLRGKVIVVNRPGLEAAAGCGYGTPEAEYRRLIAPFGKSQVRARAAKAA